MLLKLSIVIFLGFINHAHCFYATGCAINSAYNADIQEPQPLFLRPVNGQYAIVAFYLPDKDGFINIPAAQEVKVECPGGAIKVGDESLKIPSADLVCVSGTTFDLDGDRININQLSCTKHTKHVARYTDESCLKEYKEVEIGFELSTGKFINHITVCFDDYLQNTVYTVFNLTAAIDKYQVNYPRVEFIDGGFYALGDEKINNLYSRNTQREYLNFQLGLPADSTKYIHATNDYYLARGHLTAKTDFIYGSQQRLTFYYVNAVPQWQTHNAGNWLALENSVRALSSDRNMDLTVYTGPHGIAKLPHEETGEDTELYLYADEDDAIAIPIPELIWKVVYEPKEQLAVAMIGVNNPYSDGEELVICKDVCDQIKWVSWKAQDVKAGYSYCCSVPDFRKVVKTLPAFKVAGLLV